MAQPLKSLWKVVDGFLFSKKHDAGDVAIIDWSALRDTSHHSFFFETDLRIQPMFLLGITDGSTVTEILSSLTLFFRSRVAPSQIRMHETKI